MIIPITEKKLKEVRAAIEKLNKYYDKSMVLENGDGSFYKRDEGIDTSAENIIAWADKVESWEKN